MTKIVTFLPYANTNDCFSTDEDYFVAHQPESIFGEKFIYQYYAYLEEGLEVDTLEPVRLGFKLKSE